MAATQRLELRQTQSLVMTPQLQQAIRLLQLSNLELAAHIEQELEQNPLLERDEGDGWSAGDGLRSDDAVAGDALALNHESSSDTVDRVAAGTLPSESESPLDANDADFYEPDSANGTGPLVPNGTGRGAGGQFDGDEEGFEQRLPQTITMREHVLTQLQIEISDPIDRLIGIHLVEMLDGAGYLDGDLTDVAERMGCDVARVEMTLAKVQRLDPPGIFARNLRECLALQLADRNRLDPAMEALLDNLNLFANREFAKLRRICGVGEEDFADMVAELKALNPKPAAAFEEEVSEPVVPDVLMRRHPNGGWILELNQEALPRILINQSYCAMVASKIRSKADRAYYSERLQSANWLIKTLHQRATTILKVASEVVRLQEGFFEKGVRHLRPLTLRDVAEAIAMHESTVSRVTSNKFIATPRGTYELKYFFTATIGGSDGTAHSAEAVRHRIKELIGSEPSGNILSDDRIVTILRAENIDIARRTVAKYREAMRIPSSAQRRREKSLPTRPPVVPSPAR